MGTTLTLKASPTVVAYAGSTTLSGVLSTLKSGQRVDILSQDCGQGAFKKVTTVTTTTGGAFTYAAKPTMNSNYQAKQKAVTSPTAMPLGSVARCQHTPASRGACNSLEQAERVTPTAASAAVVSSKVSWMRAHVTESMVGRVGLEPTTGGL